ncbi:hypothetical protein P7D97_01515 [Enterococcus raffinosus]|uniref:hypothetical protein n=1 Tax=Enterococcus raffinosus TaxID=71452 RepID=UPI002892465C|nr:hypothetical protein [Enterococcus raffinosus]MDT2570277.1 hypothetical protein [Enterococcus raffinosus]
MARRWTEDEDTYLEYFLFNKDTHLEEAAKFLNRSLNATILRASVVRKKRRGYYICRKWTSEEDEYIKANYETVSYKLIGLRLGRSSKSVSARVRFLGLRKNQSLVAMDEQIRQMAGEGVYLVDIARSLKIEYETLRDYLSKHNINCRVMTRDESLERAREKSPWTKKKKRESMIC